MSDTPSTATSPTDPRSAGWRERAASGFIGLTGPLWTRREANGWGYAFVAEARHTNPAGIVHGGMLMTLVDHAIATVAWDSAGVTTGPVTVPLVLAMGLGFGEAVGAVEGFGILAFASIGPILSVMLTGIVVEWKIRRRHEITEREIGLEEAS